MTQKLWDSFREELMAVALVMILTASGSLYFASKITQPGRGILVEPTKSPAHEVVKGMVDALNTMDEVKQISVAPTPVSVIIPSPTAAVTVTPDPYQSEVYYGVGGLFDYPDYRLEVNSPRLVFDARSSSNRKLLVDIVLTNKTVAAGLSNRFTGVIVKDGVIIVANAAMSVSESMVIPLGESRAFQLRLSLVESTDVKEIHFNPLGQSPTIHYLLP